MAASLRSLLSGPINILRVTSHLGSRVPRRLLLSEAYSCNDAWRRHLDDPILKQTSLTDFAFSMRDELERSGRASAVDVNILAHMMSQLGDEEEVEYMEDILQRFNQCNDCIPRSDSTSHAVLRNLMDSGFGENIPRMLSERVQFGLFPNHYTLNLVLDHFIQRQQFAEAAEVAYCSMIQEDFSDPVNTWLALHACTQRLLTASSLDDLAPPPPEASDGEEDWIKVKYILYPHFDSHFDLKDERLILGKTLLMIGGSDSVEIPSDLRNTLKVIGSGLYHKFSRGLAVLSKVLESADGKILEQAVEYFSESLEKVEARAEDEPEVEIALRRIEHEMRKELPTIEEKAELVAQFAQLKEQLASRGRIVSGVDLGKTVLDLATDGVRPHEQGDIKQQVSLFETWSVERKTELERQIEMLKRNQRIEEMKAQVKELQEQEELLTYFDFEENVRLKFSQDDISERDKKLVLTKN